MKTMMKRALIWLLLTIFPCAIALTADGDKSPAQPAGEIQPVREPYGIGLEGFPYPYPVRMLPLVNDGEPVRMAR